MKRDKTTRDYLLERLFDCYYLYTIGHYNCKYSSKHSKPKLKIVIFSSIYKKTLITINFS